MIGEGKASEVVGDDERHEEAGCRMEGVFHDILDHLPPGIGRKTETETETM